MPYRVELGGAAQRDLRRLPPSVRARLARSTQALADDSRPIGVRKLQGQSQTWRIRIGPYRVVYDVYDDQQMVVILKVARRTGTTYRR